MKKVIVVGDVHLDHRRVKSRIDNYMESSLIDFKETLKIAKREKADAIIYLGDIFDIQIVTPELESMVCNVLKCDEYGEPWPFKIYSLYGNHDVDNVVSKLQKSSINILFASGLMINTNLIEEYSISCIQWAERVDEEIKLGLLKDNDSAIILAHAYIADKPNEFVSGTNCFNDIDLHEDTKLVIAGHFHYAMDVVREDGKRFINPGSLSRRNYKNDDAERQVQVLSLLINPEKKTVENIEYIPVESAQPYHLIFDLDKKEIENQDKKDVKEFTKSLHSIKNIHNVSISDSFEHLTSIATEGSISEEIAENAKRAMRLLLATKDEVND
jgi:DNA repair exonuclease SbcCD nuclease subunit